MPAVAVPQEHDEALTAKRECEIGCILHGLALGERITQFRQQCSGQVLRSSGSTAVVMRADSRYSTGK